MDTLILSRLQFGLTTAFHILFPTLTIGFAIYLVVVEFLWLRTGEEIYFRMYRFWVKLFAVNFAVGVVSGIILEFEFGTNFARFSQAVGNVIGPLFAYEALTAFFLEAGFLGVMLFGWKRVSHTMHFISTCLVALGASLSAFWIMAANAWMQFPAGYRFVNGRFMVTNFWDVIFSPTMPSHLAHMLMASYETTVFAVAGISAYYLLKGKHAPLFRKSLLLALSMAAVCAPLQPLLGDFEGLSVFHHQPAKLAAIEAHWNTNTLGGASFVAFALPDMAAERNRLEVTIPDGLSLLLTHSLKGKVLGLKEFPRRDRPYAPVIFWAFRFMVLIGVIFVLLMIWAAFLWYKKRLTESRAFLKALVMMQPAGFLATILGWMTAEMGRQPWIVYGVMRTSEAVSPIATGNVVWSLSLFVLFFGLVGASYFYYVLKILRKGPDFDSPIPFVQLRAGMRPLEESLHREEER
jgi:cytochrome d ubiquinol oxidase subunit I